MKQQLIQRLHAEGCSCVVYNQEQTLLFHQRGVQDLHHLLHSSPATLHGAMIADKVVGKAAAMVYVLLGIKEIYALVISDAAAEVFTKNGISFCFDETLNKRALLSGTPKGFLDVVISVRDLNSG